MRTQLLVGVVVALHAMAVGTLVFMQGCGTTNGGQIERADPPPAPVMPPKSGSLSAPPSPLLPTALPAPVQPIPPSSTPMVEVGEYVVQSGDVISKIAHKFGLSVRELCELNKIADPNKLRMGQRLMVPRVPGAPVPAPAPAAPAAPRIRAPEPKPVVKISPAPKSAPVAGGSTYEVKSGDSLGKIAQQQGVKVAALRDANPQLKGDLIRVGQKLTLPGAAPITTAAPSAPATAPAPTPAEPVPAPIAPAPRPDPEPVVTPPPSLPPPPAPAPAPADLTASPAPAIPSPTPAQPASSAQPYQYRVTEGQTIKTIAIAFLLEPEELAAFNNLPVDAPLKANQVILVPVKE